MNARAITMVLAGAALGLAAAFLLLPQARERMFSLPESTVSGKALIGGPFSLIDGTGKHVTEQNYRGRYMLVFFGFTSCPDVCPAGLQLISAALEKIGPKADRITPLFITLDPERDTPEKVASYVKNFNPRLVGLSGTPEEIANVAKAYRVYYQKVPAEGGAPGNYSLDHSSIIYLMDPNGEYVAHFTPTTTVEQLTAGLDKNL
jgi:cytochrome oxidase Cu insertion factor (SCO1/SenC/PrrC family)